MTKYVISGYIGMDNFGDEAICGILTGYLRQNGAEEITVISLNPEKTSRLYGVDSCGFLKFFKPIAETDVLISGGGSLLQDVTSLKSLLYYLFVIVLALFLGKKVFIFAQGFTPFRTKTGEFLTTLILKKCHRISVRDKDSQEFLSRYGIDSELVCDPVWSVSAPDILSKTGVGIQLRPSAALSEDFLRALSEEIAEIFPKEEIKLFSLQDSLDLPVLEKFAPMLTAKGLGVKIRKSLSPAETMNEISGLKYFIGMRFHSCLIAAKTGIKTLGINYDIKVKTLAQNTGFPYINPLSCEVNKGIQDLLKTEPEKYSMPEFRFPDIIP